MTLESPIPSNAHMSPQPIESNRHCVSQTPVCPLASALCTACEGRAIWTRRDSGVCLPTSCNKSIQDPLLLVPSGSFPNTVLHKGWHRYLIHYRTSLWSRLETPAQQSTEQTPSFLARTPTIKPGTSAPC